MWPPKKTAASVQVSGPFGGDAVRPQSEQSRAQAWLPWVYGVSFAGLGALIPYLALLLQRRGITGWSLAAALAVLPLSRLIAGPLWSLLADMFQAATLLIRVGAVLSLIGPLSSGSLGM